MGLTWKDGVSTLFMGAIAVIYLAFLHGTSLWLISSARGTATAVLILGMIGCMLSQAADLYQQHPSRVARAWRVIASFCGVTAFAAAIAVLASGSTVALAILVAATGVLWLAATFRHALTVPPGLARSRDIHEVIDQDRTAR